MEKNKKIKMIKRYKTGIELFSNPFYAANTVLKNEEFVRTKSTFFTADLHMNIHNSKTWKNTVMEKQNIIPCNEILFSLNKELYTDMCCYMDKP